MSDFDHEGNLWIKEGVDPYIALVNDSDGQGVRMRYDSTPLGDEGFSFGPMIDEASRSFGSSGIFFDVVLDRISISNSAFSDLDGEGLLIDGTDPQIRLRTSGDDYEIHNDAGTFKITNYTDGRDDITIDEAGIVIVDQKLGVAGTPTSTLHCLGSFALPPRSVSGATTLDSDDVTLFADPSGGNFTVDLPTAVGIGGRIYVVKNTATSGNPKVTLDGSGAETIDGSTTVDISRGDSMMIQSDNANWFIIAIA